MKKFIVIFLFSFLSLKSFAALPPFYQSAKEIQTILNDERLQKTLGSGQWIQDIIQSPNGWVIITPRYHLNVDIEYLPSKQIGPIEFELYFHDPIERQKN